jgi:hypothetical protein
MELFYHPTSQKLTRVAASFNPLGFMVWGRSDRYVLHLIHPDGRIWRIERVVDAIPFNPDERKRRIASATEYLRCVDPAWTHPQVPEVKPFFRGLDSGRDGRIWVQVSVPGEPEDSATVALFQAPRSCPSATTQIVTREPAVYDVFEPTGEFIGRVRTPWNAVLLAASGDAVWLLTRDENDVPSATKYKVSPSFVHPVRR